MRVLAVALSLLGGCAAVSPDPARMAEELPADVPIEAGLRARAATRADEAVALADRGELVAARRAAAEALADDPRAARALAAIAKTIWSEAAAEEPPRLYDWRRAEGELRRATALAPDDPVVARIHAEFLERDGHLTAAAARCEEALTHAEDADLRGRAGRLRFELGEVAAARSHLEARLAAVPSDADAWYRLAVCRLEAAAAVVRGPEQRELYREAGAVFGRYSELRPDDPAGPAGAGFCLLQAGDAEQALAAYERAAALGPDAAVEHGRSAAMAAAGRRAEARAALERALELDPQFVPALFDLATVLHADGDVDGASALWRRALECDISAAERRRIEHQLRGSGR